MMAPARMKKGMARSAKLVDAVGDLQHHRFERNAAPPGGDDGGEAERIGDRNAEKGEDREAADQDDERHASPARSVARSELDRAAGRLEPARGPRRMRSITNSTMMPPPIGIGR